MKPQNPFSTDNIDTIKNHVDIFKSTHIPRNLKGDEYNNLTYTIKSKELLNDFFEAFIKCEYYEGSLTVESEYFDDNVYNLFNP